MLSPTLVRFPLLTLLFACAPFTAAATPTTIGPPPAPADLDISFDVQVGQPTMIAGQAQTAYINITLGGFALPNTARAPINLALVLDRSASMAGDRLEKAKEAALMVVDRLRPDDVISVISFDSTVEVLVPAAKANERDHIRERISALTPRGSTALFSGVTFGIEEVKKNLDPTRVNRIILLSDGQANVGPSSPNELGRLGEVAARQGVTITTIGLGLDYNEDLMTQLAMRSDGNHAFAENAADLAKIFSYELGDILSVVAQDVEIHIDFADGITPVRAIGRDATISGRRATLAMSQLYAKQEKHVVFEVNVPPGAAGGKRALADVGVSYANMISKRKGQKRSAVAVEFSGAKDVVASRQNTKVMEAAVEAIATDENRRAVALRDAGRVQEAQVVLENNATYLRQNATQLKSRKLDEYSVRNAEDAQSVKAAPDRWNRARKEMREGQMKNSYNRGW